MPTVKDKATGEVISRQRYNEKGIQNAASIADSNPSWEIDYAPGGENNAPDMRESYQLGGKIPGQLGFGIKPPRSILNDLVPPTDPGFGGQGQGHVGDKDWFDDPRKGGGAYKKGGKVK